MAIGDKIMTEPLIIYKQEKGIGVIRLNRPPLNIFNKEMSALLDEILTKVETDATLRVVILCAEGRTFSAGSDMKEILDYIENGTYIDGKMTHELSNRNRIANLPIPTIAAVESSAYGGGFEMILSCDMILSSPSATYSMATTDIGSYPGAGGGARLIRLVGRSRAMEHMYFSRKMTAQEGLEWGMINAIASEGTAFDLAMQWAEEIASKPDISMRTVKELVNGLTIPDEKYTDDLHQRISGKVIEAGKLQEGIEQFFFEKEARKKIEN